MHAHDYDFRLPRLFVEDALQQDSALALNQDQTHYLKTVMRRPDGAKLRVFNGRDGEWGGVITYEGKKSASLALTTLIRPQGQRTPRLHLVFAPVKKDRMDFMIEKAVELGACALHPVLTQYTVIRDLNADRVTRQITEAAEQCERLDLPGLSPLCSLKDFARTWNPDLPVYAALERHDATLLGQIRPLPAECGLLIGPEGGWSDEERTFLLGLPFIRAVSLGEQILRSETAAIFGLSLLTGNFTK
jgi:16S rRNA (uracil1498-N3)-methyltransferase